jgi:putative hydrolase of HD superfamily
MITRRILQLLYDAASIQRWNDHARPFEMVELGKQAHKMVIAWVIGRFEEQSPRMPGLDWQGIIEGGIFEFLQRIVLTDIKPAVFHRMMEEKGRELNQFVIQRVGPDIDSIQGGFRERFERYLLEPEWLYREKRVLQAAHYMATNWEFRFIYQLNPSIYGIQKTKAEIENRLEDFYDLIGVQKISLGRKSYGFIDLCGQLRFQKRWSGTVRVPQTSVLGHMLIVAVFSYLCALEMGACYTRRYNDFFAGLFHDLPEVLTRDIISPVKQSVEGLDDIIKEYEMLQFKEVLLPLVPSSWHEELLYFNTDEFLNKAVKENQWVYPSETEMETIYNSDEYNPVDGVVIRACDRMAAFIEAQLSVDHGVTSPHLVGSIRSLTDYFRGRRIGPVDFELIMQEFLKEPS